MGDEHGPALAEFGRRDGNFGGDRHAGEGCQPRRSNLQGEQGGHGRFDGVAKRRGELPGSGSAATAGGEEQTIANELLIANGKFKLAGGIFHHGLDGAVEAYAHAGGLGGVDEAVHDGLGGIGDGEHPAVGFGFKFHAPRLEPGNGVARGEFLERREQCFAAARIADDEFAGLEAGMGDVATAAAGDADFVQHARGFFEQDDPAPLLRRRDGGEESRRAAADHNDLPRIHRDKIA